MHNTNIQTKMFLQGLENKPGTSRKAVWGVTCRPPRQLNVSIELRLFHYFNVMGRNINNQS